MIYLIEIKDLSYIYQSHKQSQLKALESINLKIDKGDFISIIGSNGSGKSTLAKHLNCLLLPTSGDIWVDGMNTKDKEKVWQIRQKVGMVFQNPDNQIVATTVEDDIAFGLENIGISEEVMRERINWALQVVEMEEYKKSEPHLLSGGQKQRVAIAGALAMHSSYLVLDEPTAMLDPKGRIEVLNTLQKLNCEENITVIYITHLMEEVVDSDKIVVLDAGKIVLMGTPKQIFIQVKYLEKLKLDVPQITELAIRLSEKGLGISPHILKVEEMVNHLCLYV